MSNIQYNLEDLKEVGAISAYLSDHYADKLYNTNEDLGYIQCIYTIGSWAIEFHNNTKHINVDGWEDYYDKGYLMYDVNKNSVWKLEGCCWDDYIIEFGKFKIREYE